MGQQIEPLVVCQLTKKRNSAIWITIHLILDRNSMGVFFTPDFYYLYSLNSLLLSTLVSLCFFFFLHLMQLCSISGLKKFALLQTNPLSLLLPKTPSQKHKKSILFLWNGVGLLFQFKFKVIPFWKHFFCILETPSLHC